MPNMLDFDTQFTLLYFLSVAIIFLIVRFGNKIELDSIKNELQERLPKQIKYFSEDFERRFDQMEKRHQKLLDIQIDSSKKLDSSVRATEDILYKTELALDKNTKILEQVNILCAMIPLNKPEKALSHDSANGTEVTIKLFNELISATQENIKLQQNYEELKRSIHEQ